MSNTSGATVAILDFIRSVPGDLIGDKQFAEICRRLQATIEGQADSDIWGETAEPTDRTLVWWPKDPTSGSRIGQPKVYSYESNAWVPVGSELKFPEKRERREGTATLNAGTFTVNISFDGWGSDKYFVQIAPLAKKDGGWIPAPANMNNFAWIVTNQAVNQFTLTFYNVPSGGIDVHWQVTEINPDKY